MNSLSGRSGALAICILAGCASTSPDIASGNYVLTEHQQLALSPALALHYDRYADSRCPQNVQCVWAGKRSYQFTLAGPKGKETFTLDAGGAPFASTINGVSIELAQTDVAKAAPASHAVALYVVAK